MIKIYIKNDIYINIYYFFIYFDIVNTEQLHHRKNIISRIAIQLKYIEI